MTAVLTNRRRHGLGFSNGLVVEPGQSLDISDASAAELAADETARGWLRLGWFTLAASGPSGVRLDVGSPGSAPFPGESVSEESPPAPEPDESADDSPSEESPEPLERSQPRRVKRKR